MNHRIHSIWATPAIALVCGLLVTGCGAVVKPGKPTPLRQTGQPAAALCDLRTEFLALEKPILKKFRFHRAYSEHNWPNSPTKIAEYYEPIITPRAKVFATGHTRLELLAALLPYIDDPAVGAEAAILLAAIPGNLSYMAHDHLSAITYPIHQSQYKSPTAKGAWSPELAVGVKAEIARMFGLGSTYNLASGNLPTAATLEGCIVTALQAQELFPLRHAAPEILAFTTDHSDALSLTVIYAMALWPHVRGQNWEINVLIRALHLEHHADRPPTGEFDSFPDGGRVSFHLACSQALLDLAQKESQKAAAASH